MKDKFQGKRICCVLRWTDGPNCHVDAVCPFVSSSSSSSSSSSF